MSDDAAECLGSNVAGKTQKQTVFRDEFDRVGWQCRRRLDLNGQEGKRRRLGRVMFVDPVLDGLRRATKLTSNLCNGTLMLNNLFDGAALNGKIVARGLFRHRKSERKMS